MDKRTTDIVAYLTWVGLIIAFVAGDRENAKFHMNQALVIDLFGLLSGVSFLGWTHFVGWLWGIFMTVCWFIGIIAAISGQEKPIPLLGNIRILT